MSKCFPRRQLSDALGVRMGWINSRLSHCHLDYFNNVFNFNFSGPASFDPLEANGVSQLSDFTQKNILICVSKMNESLTELDKHEGE